MTDNRMNLDLITDMFGLLDRHGYTRSDNEHTGRAILLLGDLARIYEGSQDHPFGPYIGEVPPRPEPVPPEPARHDAVTVPIGEVKTLISALIIAADYKRDRAEMCADCRIVFIGPPAAAMVTMGDKVEAREAMSKGGLPMLPGTDIIRSLSELLPTKSAE